MALKKCKECGGQVSTKAKLCPKCGAKAPKKTSIVTWVALVFIILVIYASFGTSTGTKSSATSQVSKNSSTQTKRSEIAKVVTPQEPTWTTIKSKDEMTGEVSSHTFSPTTYPTRKMAFPYGDVNASLAVGCDKSSEWVYVTFNKSPNLTGTETKDGYNLVKTKIKWNDEIEDVVLTQMWSAKSLHFRNASSVLAKISSSNSALLQLRWHGEQSVYFEFSLKGSSKAIAEMRAICSR